jgi:hypothetical protein
MEEKARQVGEGAIRFAKMPGEDQHLRKNRPSAATKDHVAQALCVIGSNMQVMGRTHGLVRDGIPTVVRVEVGNCRGLLRLDEGEGHKARRQVGGGKIKTDIPRAVAFGDAQVFQRDATGIEDQERPLALLAVVVVDQEQVLHVDRAIGVEVKIGIFAIERIDGEEVVLQIHVAVLVGVAGQDEGAEAGEQLGFVDAVESAVLFPKQGALGAGGAEGRYILRLRSTAEDEQGQQERAVKFSAWTSHGEGWKMRRMSGESALFGEAERSVDRA